jgi:flagellar protein FliL
MAKTGDKDKAAEGEKAGGKAGLLGNKKLLFGAAGGLVLLLGGGGAAFFLMGGEEPPATAADAAAAQPEVVAYYYDLPIMIVNLAAVDNRTSYVKLEVSLELPEAGMVEILQPNLPRVLDAFQTYMRELRPTDLSGSAGLFRLKEELQRRVNIAVYPARVDDVLFKNIVVQ